MRPVLPLLALLGTSTLALASDLYVTPTGSGKRDGSSWNNALAQQALDSTINEKMKPGDRLMVGGGTYPEATLSVTAGGAPGKPKVIVGMDRGAGLPIFTGSWTVDAPTKGTVAIDLKPGVSHVTFEGLRLQGYVMGVRSTPVKDGQPRTNLTFKDVDVKQARHPYYLSDCDDLRLIGCDAIRYSKHGFRFDQGCNRVLVQQCVADCSEGDTEWEKKTELFPFGFSLNDGGAPNTDFTFEDCLSTHNLMPLQTGKYKNGDGYVIEGNSTNVSFLRCRSISNQDGGFDLKVRDVKLTDCVSVGNSRGFRVWSTGTLTNCFVGFGATGLWCNGGPVAVTHSTFHALSKAAVMTDDKATLGVSLSDCLITGCGKPAHQTAHGVIALGNALVFTGSEVSSKVGYQSPAADWNGLGDAMNPKQILDKGYHPVTSRRAP